MEQLALRFQENLPPKPYCSKTKGPLNIYPKAIAIGRQYIQHNPPHLCAWLVFDCDHTNQFIFKDAGLPAPSWIASTPATGRFHAAYAIESVFTTINARAKPLAYLAAIQRVYTKLLNADPGYSGLITKNPLHVAWNVWFVHDHVYSLGELADYVDLSEPRQMQRSFGFGRNVDLFDRTRKWAYRNVHKSKNNMDFESALLAKTESFNESFDAPLGYNEVKSVAKSICKYVWRRSDYYASRYERKLGLNEELPLETKQALGAAYTASVKSDSSLAKIKAAKAMLVARNEKATQKAVALATGLGISTVKRHWKES